MQNNKPNCLGFIMDGNRRWATANNLPTLEGHRQGAQVFINTVRYVRDKGIPNAVFYAFSSENWQRKESEVSYLLDLFAEQIKSLQQALADDTNSDKRVRFRFIGDLGKFSDSLQQEIALLEKKTREVSDTTIWVALSYGGREEILAAVNRAIATGTVVDEAQFTSLMWSAEMPDPDLIIRTGGQRRLSNFYWPDITNVLLDELLEEFFNRTRNFGI
jgi:undecaprenyl diphosphate synthase